ncbi:MAG: methylated-DNA--[protein]-cysteine S-methyltransferase [Clostridiaceae bacterium]|nr:methylated-DNA--[protein]-cysteine S-methyltransferase [Clostridiaceae bacterium]
MKVYFSEYASPLGKLYIANDEQGICNISFPGQKEKFFKWLQKNFNTCVEQKTDMIAQAINELNEYFIGKRKVFAVPIHLIGTEFQKRVWNKLMEIPYGTTVSYGFIASQIGNIKASRAVGSANNKNPVPIIVPCHRVIGARGNLVGYGGGLDIKTKLLEIEGVQY